MSIFSIDEHLQELDALHAAHIQKVAPHILGIMQARGITLDDLKAFMAEPQKAQKARGRAQTAPKAATKAEGKATGKKRRGSALKGRKLNLPPKYQDPATGATWTGHGRAPAWIANAKNRDTFLIAQE